MKRIITLLTCAFAVIAMSAQNAVSITQFIDSYNNENAGHSENGITYGYAYTEGNNIIMPATLDESELVTVGMNVIDAINFAGGVDAMQQELKNEIFANPTPEDLEDFKLLREMKYNLIFRFIGSNTGKSVDLIIKYTEIP